MGAIRELIDYSAGMALASKADAELAAQDAELATLQLALQDMESQYLCGVELCRSKDATIARLRSETSVKDAALRLVIATAGCHTCSQNKTGNHPERCVGCEIPTCESALSDDPLPGAFLSLEQLREIEWSKAVKVAPEGGLIQSCPACHEWKSDGHKPDCWLGNARKGDTNEECHD